MIRPVRLQLSRRKGFRLQELSRATNGLPAVNVARPSRWGNPVTEQDFEVIQRALANAGARQLRGTWRDHAIKCFDAWIGGEIPELGTPPALEEITNALRGRNLACWCKLGWPCRADVLLDLANRPVCEEAG